MAIFIIMIRYFFPLILLLFTACQSGSNSYEQYLNEVKDLTELEDQRAFLENIYTHYINLRQSETDQWNQFGRYSSEYKSMVIKNRAEDEEDLNKIKAFLDTHGHPSIMKVGYKACVTPTIQLIQSDDMYEQKNYYRYIYDAYRFNDIKPEVFLEYLKSYSKSSGKIKLRLDPEVAIDEKIELYIQHLGLNK